VHRICVGALVRRDEGGTRILLGHRSAGRAFFPDVWDFPGGHVEPGESHEETLARELEEEIGIRPTAWRRFGEITGTVPGSDEPVVLHLFEVSAWTGEPLVVDPAEHDKLGWFSPDEAGGLDLADHSYRDVFSRLGRATRLTQRIAGPRADVYRAFVDGDVVQRWMVPDGMTSRVHAFDGREGGVFRTSLTYDAPTDTGKTTAQTDTYHGRFVELVPNERVVQVVEFETENPAMQGEMTITIELRDAEGGTELVATHDDLPPGLSPADNELGWRISLGKLAALLEAR
jgi:mutator protein MutT